MSDKATYYRESVPSPFRQPVIKTLTWTIVSAVITGGLLLFLGYGPGFGVRFWVEGRSALDVVKFCVSVWSFVSGFNGAIMLLFCWFPPMRSESNRHEFKWPDGLNPSGFIILRAFCGFAIISMSGLNLRLLEFLTWSASCFPSL